MAKRKHYKNKNLPSAIGKNVKMEEHSLANLELLNDMVSNSIPRNLTYGAIRSDTIAIVTRDTELLERDKMLSDTFVREMVKVIIVRAIGTTHDNVKPFSIELKSDIEMQDSFREVIQKDLDYLVGIIDDNLIEIAIMSQGYGDGFVKKEFNDKDGVTKLLNNYSLHPLNIIPIVSNRGDTIAYEVSNNTSVIQNTKNLFAKTITKNNRFYSIPLNVARMNASGNGIDKPTQENLATLDNMNVFNEETTVYEDGIYGGVLEGCYDSYIKFKYALESINNQRIANGVTERFILHTMGSTSENERKILKTALENQLKATIQKMKDRVNTKDPSVQKTNYVIPTTEEGTNGISIQESTPSAEGLQQIEDIMLQLKKFLGDVGFNIELTPFGSGMTGGRERDGAIQNSIQMDAQGTQIRKSIRNYVLDIVKTHFLAKYNLEIDLETIEVKFQSVLNQAKLTAETQRMEFIANQQSFLAIVEQFRALGLEDTPDTKIMLKSQLQDMISQASDNKEEQIETFIKLILTKPKTEEGAF